MRSAQDHSNSLKLVPSDLGVQWVYKNKIAKDSLVFKLGSAMNNKILNRYKFK